LASSRTPSTGSSQLGSQLAGHSLDNLLLNPLTGGAASINIYGAIGGQNIYRVNALTGDPNHLGVMLIVPLLALTPVYLRLPRGDRLRWPLAIALVFLLLVDIATFSRSGGVGLIAGALVLVVPYRRFFRSRQFLYPLGAVVVVLLGVLYTHRHFFETFCGSESRRRAARPTRHFAVYSFIGQVLTCTLCSGSATTTSPSTTSS